MGERPKSLSQVWPPREGGAGALSHHPHHSLSMSISLVSVKNSQSIAASAWMTARLDTPRYNTATAEGDLASEPSHVFVLIHPTLPQSRHRIRIKRLDIPRKKDEHGQMVTL